MADVSEMIADLKAILDGRAPSPPAFAPEREDMFVGLSGFTVDEPTQILPNVSLRPAYVDVFSSTMAAFEPPAPEKPHNGSWIAVERGDFFEVRVELLLPSDTTILGYGRKDLVRLISALIRLKLQTNARAVIIANKPLALLPKNKKSARILPMEARPSPIVAKVVSLDSDSAQWLGQSITRAVALMSDDDKFSRAFPLMDEARWASTLGASVQLHWTAMEIMLNISTSRQKGRDFSEAFSSFVEDGPDRDWLYQTVRKTYGWRGQIAHGGREPSQEQLDLISYLSRVIFLRAVDDMASVP